jgi:hypothetical protein
MRFYVRSNMMVRQREPMYRSVNYQVQTKLIISAFPFTFFSFVQLTQFTMWYAKAYDPIQAASIDGTDTEPHDAAVVRALNAECEYRQGMVPCIDTCKLKGADFPGSLYT